MNIRSLYIAGYCSTHIILDKLSLLDWYEFKKLARSFNAHISVMIMLLIIILPTVAMTVMICSFGDNF